MIQGGDHYRRFQIKDPLSANPLLLREVIGKKIEVISFHEVTRTIEQVYLKAMEQVHHD